MQAPNKKALAAPFFSSVCILFVIFKPNFPVDSPNSNFNFFPRCYGGDKLNRRAACIIECRSIGAVNTWLA